MPVSQEVQAPRDEVPNEQRGSSSSMATHELLERLKEAHRLLGEAWGRQKEITELGTKLHQKERALRSRLDERNRRRKSEQQRKPEDIAVEVHRRLRNSREQQRIDRIYGERDEAQATPNRLWSALVPSLDRYRSAETRDLFNALDGLTPYPGPENLNRRIGLAEQILRKGAPSGALPGVHGAVVIGESERPGELESRLHQGGSSTPIQSGPRSVHVPQVAAKVKEHIRQHGVTRGEFARRAKVSAKTIGKLLNDKVATPSTLDEIARAMKTTKEELLMHE